MSSAQNLFCLFLFPMVMHASGMTELLSRGYSAVPEPQKVSLRGQDFQVTRVWTTQQNPAVAADSPSIRSLSEGLSDRFQMKLAKSAPGLEISFIISPGSIQPGNSQDPDRNAIANQAYDLLLSPTRIEVKANSETGCFYAVQTILQLMKTKAGKLYLPEAEIVDWPDLRLRTMYWDDAHHLERLTDLKQAIRQASFFKMNGFALKLEGHFMYRSAPAIVEPQALSAAQLQELTDYGLRYHVELIPYLDAPAHVAFILKHPEYASLRQFPDSNYELCATNPRTLELLYGMYDDLLAANRGVHYFYLSTDEAYYIGMEDSPTCQEGTRRKELGSPGKVLAEFLKKAAGHLHDAGREVIFWGELPLKPADIPSLPPFVINGETYGPKFDPLFKAHGIRQMIYGSTEGEERLFPQYDLLPAARRTMPLHEKIKRVPDGIKGIVSDPARKTADLIGLTIAGWADMGLHPETFWLGYAVITATGWKPWTIDADSASKSFYPLFYGPKVEQLDRIYQLMSYQAQIWTNTWDTVPSTARKPIWGDSEKIFRPGKPAQDQALPMLPALKDNLAYQSSWSKASDNRLHSVSEALKESDELTALLTRNLPLATANRYNLEVFQSIALLCRQNLKLLQGLQQMDSELGLASTAASANKPSEAVKLLDSALSMARQIRADRNQVLETVTAVWYKSWLPRVMQANGRTFLHQVDDVKDHLPDRTVDMTYLIYRDLQLPFDDWYLKAAAARNRYAQSHGLAVAKTTLNWSQHP